MRSYHLCSPGPAWLPALGAVAYCGEEGKALGAKEAEGSVASGGRDCSRGLFIVRGDADIWLFGVCASGVWKVSCCGRRIFAVGGGGMFVRIGCRLRI